jgi:hypothetical protein
VSHDAVIHLHAGTAHGAIREHGMYADFERIGQGRPVNVPQHAPACERPDYDPDEHRRRYEAWAARWHKRLIETTPTETEGGDAA